MKGFGDAANHFPNGLGASNRQELISLLPRHNFHYLIVQTH